MRHHSSFAPPVIKSDRTVWQTIRSLLPYLWPKDDRLSRLRVVVAVAFLIAAKVATVTVPVVYSRAVDALVPKDPAQAMLAVPLSLIIGYGLLRVASSGFGEMRDAVFAAVQQRTVRRVALQTFEHLHKLSLRFHLDRQTGGLSRSLDRGTTGIESVLRLAVFNIVPTLIEVLMVTAVIWRLFDWRYAGVTLAAVACYIGFTLSFTNWRVRFRRAMNEVDSEAQSKAVDSLLNYETVKYFGNEAHEARRYDEALARYERAAVKSQVSLNFLNLGQASIVAAALAVIMLMAARGVHDGSMTVGRFVLVNTYLIQLYTPLNLLGFVYREMKQGLVDMEQMFRLLAVEQEVADRPEAVDLPAHLHDQPAGAVVFEDVRFGYRPDREILKGVDLEVPAGKRLAIVGPTGAGKSTISRLLFRFYDATSGRILVDGHDIRDLKQNSLRAAIGVVPQDTVLFNDTIRYNIAYGRPGASQAEIEHAARLAQVHDFVQRLPDGYDTRVGERGLKLSGGEKQRVAIARTILKDPRILILDEATSALDTGTEQEIQMALRAVTQNRTTLVIAHRLSTVVDADEIIVLQDGSIAERGSHAGLLAQDGLYARMWAMQAEQEPESLAVAAVALSMDTSKVALPPARPTQEFRRSPADVA
jgi:ABC-type transport system involved in Fe-S cluster assembly fused permease/ATPase subunit